MTRQRRSRPAATFCATTSHLHLPRSHSYLSVPQKLHGCLLLLHFLLLCTAVPGCNAAAQPPPPEQRLNIADGTTICPCAFLERGGFWTSEIASTLGIDNGVYVESRCSCSIESNCLKQWQESTPKAITVSWIGAEGVSVTQIQLQFCSTIYPPDLATCLPGEVTFSLRQFAWWVDLHGVFCRCPDSSGTPVIHRFIYTKPVKTRNDTFNGQLVDFTCESKPVCQANEWCYEERLDSRQSMTHGTVTCSCPNGTYCPIYSLEGAREPLQEGASKSLIGYRLRCRLESKPK